MVIQVCMLWTTLPLSLLSDYLVMRLLSRKLGEPLRRGMEGLRAYDLERVEQDLEVDLQGCNHALFFSPFLPTQDTGCTIQCQWKCTHSIANPKFRTYGAHVLWREANHRLYVCWFRERVRLFWGLHTLSLADCYCCLPMSPQMCYDTITFKEPSIKRVKAKVL